MNQDLSRCLALLLLALSTAACGGSTTTFQTPSSRLKAARGADGRLDDRSMCEWRGRPEREMSEVAGPGSLKPNVRRVYQIVGVGEDRHKVLICREIDTNFDGIKDVVRRYNDKGESIGEEADSNYDGRIDTWIAFVKGRLAEVKLDTNYDGNPDEWKYYSGGKLSRITRDKNRDGKPDIWEIYREGHLERMGVDVDGDEHVDRWDHDNELRRRFDDLERRKEDEAAAAAAKKANAEKAAADKANEAVDNKATKDEAGDKDKSAATPAPQESSKRKQNKK